MMFRGRTLYESDPLSYNSTEYLFSVNSICCVPRVPFKLISSHYEPLQDLAEMEGDLRSKRGKKEQLELKQEPGRVNVKCELG